MGLWSYICEPAAVPLIVLISSSIFKVVSCSIIQRKYLKTKPKKTRVEVARVSAIYYYPVKSCHSIQLDEAECSYSGLHKGDIQDRQWMITDKDNVFLSGLYEHKLVLVQPSFHEKEMWLDAPDMETLKIPVEVKREDPVVSVTCYKDIVEAVDCGPEAGKWFSRYLDKPGCHLVIRPNWIKPRKIQDGATQWHKQQTPLDKIEFQRESPVILGSEASAEDLNSRIDSQIDIRNFRPNIVVTGCQAFDEDEWEEIEIGTALFRKFKLIQRCLFTTVDPDTGVVDKKATAYKMMGKYRRFPEYNSPSPSFCTSLVLDNNGIIHQGDIVYAAV